MYSVRWPDDEMYMKAIQIQVYDYFKKRHSKKKLSSAAQILDHTTIVCVETFLQ